MDLHAEHLEDLKRSGLNDDTIAKANITTVIPTDINTELGFNIPALLSLYKTPYGENFARYKAFYEPGINGTHPKYLQRKNSGNRLYIPEQVKPVLSDVSVALYFTEGEKKTLRACQEGLACIGLSGLWNWSNGEKKLLPDFDLIELKGRDVYLIPDNDYKLPNKHGYNKNLEQAVDQLAAALIKRGTKVQIIELPQGELKGLDDYLCKHSIDQFKSLPCAEVVPLKDRIEHATIEEVEGLLTEIARIRKPIEREALLGLIAKKFKIRKDALRQEINASKDADENITASFVGLIDIADDNGTICFLVLQNDELLISDIHLIENKSYVPPDRQQIPFKLADAQEVLKWYGTDDPELFNDVVAYLKQFSYLSQEQWLILACFVFLTYLQEHKSIDYLPVILFFAIPERGKSRTGKSLIYICYRGVHLPELRETNIFRFSQHFKSTLFFDIMNVWQKAERNNSEDILLLRYEKGAQCARVLYPERGAFKDTAYFDVYGPTIIATNEALHKILDSRCLPITMINRPGQYLNPTPEAGLELKARLTAWRAKTINKELPDVGYEQSLEGRIWDICKPVLQMAKMVSAENYETVKEQLIKIAKQRREDQAEYIEGRIIKIINDLANEKSSSLPEIEIENKAILEVLNKDITEQKDKFKPEYLGRKLKALSLRKKKTMYGAAIVFTRHELKLLCSQHGIDTEDNNTDAPTSDKSIISVMPVINEDNTDSLKHDGAEINHHTTIIKPSCEDSKVSQTDSIQHDSYDGNDGFNGGSKADKMNIILDEIGDDVEFIE